MFRRILVPIDGSRFAEIAVPVALSLAEREGGTVRLLLVHDSKLNAVPLLDGSILDPEVDDAMRDQERSYLAAFTNRCASDRGIVILSDVVDGRAGPTLVAHASSWPADLIVMTTHGRGPLARLWLGSVADYAIRHLSIPLVLLRPRDDADWKAGEFQLQSILVPLDFSTASQAIVEPAAVLAKRHGARVELVHVVEPAMGPGPLPVGPTSAVPDIDQRTRVMAEHALGAMAASLRARGIEAVATVLVSSSVAAALIERIRERSPDLVAIATHGRGGIRRTLIGSVADKVIRASPQPVFVLRPPGV